MTLNIPTEQCIDKSQLHRLRIFILYMKPRYHTLCSDNMATTWSTYKRSGILESIGRGQVSPGILFITVNRVRFSHFVAGLDRHDRSNEGRREGIQQGRLEGRRAKAGSERKWAWYIHCHMTCANQ